MPKIIRDLSANLVDSVCIDAAVKTADANGTSIDLQQYRNGGFLFVVGASGDTLSGSVYIELEVEESSDNSTWTDVADADLNATVTGTNTGTVAKIDDAAEDSTTVYAEYKGTKRYIRPVINVTGTHTNGTPIGVVGLRYNAR